MNCAMCGVKACKNNEENEAKTDLNVVVGLCIGHDSLFFKYSEAPVTVLAVKDRILAHNPLGAVYLSESAYRKKLFPSKD